MTAQEFKPTSPEPPSPSASPEREPGSADHVEKADKGKQSPQQVHANEDQG